MTFKAQAPVQNPLAQGSVKSQQDTRQRWQRPQLRKLAANYAESASTNSADTGTGQS
jgi:hypothetical protein